MSKIDLKDRYIKVPVGFKVEKNVSKTVEKRLSTDALSILDSLDRVVKVIRDNQNKNNLIVLNTVMIRLNYFKKDLWFNEKQIEYALRYLVRSKLFIRTKTYNLIYNPNYEGE